jgi:hypothetical protein
MYKIGQATSNYTFGSSIFQSNMNLDLNYLSSLYKCFNSVNMRYLLHKYGYRIGLVANS